MAVAGSNLWDPTIVQNLDFTLIGRKTIEILNLAPIGYKIENHTPDMNQIMAAGKVELKTGGSVG